MAPPRTPQGSRPSPSYSSPQNTTPKIYTMSLDPKQQQQAPDPPRAVQNLEDSVATAMSTAVQANRDVANAKFAPRTDYGERGKTVRVWSNHFVITFPPGLVLHVYRIKLPLIKDRGTEKEQEISGRKRVQIVKLLLEQNKVLQGDNRGRDIVTDFHSMLISKRDLGPEINTTVIYRHEDEKQAAADPPSYEVEIQKDKEQSKLHLETFIKHLRSSDITEPVDTPNFGTLVQALNIFLNFHAKTKEDLATMGPRNVFSFSENSKPKSLGGGAVAMSGYYSSVRPAGGRFLANVDLSCAAFHDPQIELRKLAELWSRDTSGLDQFLRFVRIKTKHMTHNKVKTICGLAKSTDGRPVDKNGTGQPHPPQGEKDGNTFRDIELGAGPKRVHFWMEDPKAQGRYISVWDFFRQNYKIDMDDKIPVVNVGSQKRPVYLPAEACQVQPGQSVKGTLNPKQTAEMVKIACRSPADTFGSIRPQGADTVGLHSPLLGHFGVTTARQMLTVYARLLPPPAIHYHPVTTDMPPSDGGLVRTVKDASWNLRGCKVIRPGTMTKWRCLILCPIDSDQMKNIESGLFDSFSRQGITRSKPMSLLNQSSFRMSNRNSVQQLLKSLRTETDNLDMLVVVLPDDNKVVYNMIKSVGDVQKGLVTQCILRHKATKRGSSQDQYFDNVALKVNVKLRGENHLVKSPASKFIQQNDTLIIGADVTHPGGPLGGGPLSFAALVGMTTPKQGQYVARFSVQGGGHEMIEAIGAMFSDLLDVWKSTHNQRLPKNVVYLRDGLSEGQFDKLYKEEIPQLRKAYKDSSPGMDTELHVFAASVQKRHHKRFAPTQLVDADKTGNCKAGLVVDRGITEPRCSEFYLQAHTAIKGTARPIHVFVACDEVTGNLDKNTLSGLNKSDFMQDLVHTLCWDFGRATRAVSLPAPVFYAHLAADRARRYVAEESRKNQHRTVTAAKAREVLEVHPRMRDTMFFV